MSDMFPGMHVDPAGLKVPPSDIYVAFDTADIAEQFGATVQQLQVAARRAAMKTRNKLMTHMLEAQASMGFPRKELKLRYRKINNKTTGQKSAWSNSYNSATLWIGVNPLSAHRLTKSGGRELRGRKGVKIKQWFFDRAFKANVYGPDEKIWRRKGAERGPGLGVARLPVILMTVPIDEMTERLIERFEPSVAHWFEEIFEHELKFEMGWYA